MEPLFEALELQVVERMATGEGARSFCTVASVTTVIVLLLALVKDCLVIRRVIRRLLRVA